MANDFGFDCADSKTKKGDLRIASLNARGLRDKVKRTMVAQWFDKQNVDILCLQETFCTKDFETTFNDTFNHYADDIKHSFTDSSHSRGSTIMTRKGSNIVIDNVIRKENGRQIIVNAKYNNKMLTIVNIYAPSIINDRISFFKRITGWINQNIDESNTLIICGDFNSVTSSKDRTTGKMEKCSHHFKKIIDSFHLVDSYKTINPDSAGYTWIDPADPSKMSRLDYVFTSQFLLHSIKQSVVNNAPVPDHKAVITDLKIDDKSRGPGYWKLNTTLLNDEKYKQKILEIYDNTVNEYGDIESKRVIWDLFKLRVKEYSIRYSIEKRSKEKDETERLNMRLNQLDEFICKNPDNITDVINERGEIKNKLKLMSMSEAKGYQIRSRVKWLEEGEKNTKYFANLENKRQTYNCIQHLKKQNNQSGNEIVESDKDILNEIRMFYGDLYKSERPSRKNIVNYLNTIPVTKTLNDIEKEICDSEITEEECKQVIRHMKENKSPGMDGLPIEFYKIFWTNIGTFLIQVYNESLNEGELSYSQRTAIMSLIFKKGDRMLLKNYRPISLSTADYKILAFVLANRLQCVLNKIISTTQGAYIKKRFIGCNIRLIEDLIDYAGIINDESMIMFLDFEKAFDTVEWEFMFEVLKKFNFGEVFIKWIKTLYASARSKVKNNGWISQDIIIERGIRQGCPVSALLFIIVSEILAINIKNNEDIKGIKVETNSENVELKISQYADDGHIFLSDINSLENAIEAINVFSKVAGPKLNIDKCEIIPLRKEVINFQNMRCVKNARCLGVWVGKEKSTNEEKNWNEKLCKLKTCLQVWKTRNLTIFGKTTVIKMLGMSKVVYSATNTLTPEGFITRLNTILFDFLWQGKDRIKRSKLVGDIAEGGIAMIESQCAFESLKITWINRYIQSLEENNQWSIIMRKYIEDFGKNNIILHMTFQKQEEFPYMNSIPPFYREVITAFCKSKDPVRPNNEFDLLRSIIWGNRFITYQGKRNKQMTLYSKEWVKHNIICVKDLLIINGKISVQYISDTINCRINIFTDISRLNIALRPYRHLLNNNIPNNVVYALPSTPQYINKNNNYDIKEHKSRFYYKFLREKVVTNPFFHEYFGNDTDTSRIPKVKEIFISKVLDIKENKLKEFNYKCLHKIGACGKLLSKWNQSFELYCDCCNAEESQVHIIYNCPETKNIWQKISEYLNVEIDEYNIMFGFPKDAKLNNIISQIAFSIHKYWLIRKNENKVYVCQDLKYLIKHDLMYKSKILIAAKYIEIGKLYENMSLQI